MIIVTGAAGFIGSNLVNTLFKIGFEVYVCDEKKYIINRKYFILNKNYITVDNLGNFIKKNHNNIRAVVHMGAISSTAEQSLKKLLDNNTLFSYNLFKLCNKYKIKFIYASSAATYGNESKTFNDENNLLNYIKLKPINYYGLSKHLFDLKVLEEMNLHRTLPSYPVGLKFFNVYGQNESHKKFMSSPIPKFYDQAKLNGTIKLFKSNNKSFDNGKQSRDFVYIQDCIDVIVWFINNPKKYGIFNLGSGKSETFLDLAKIIFDVVKIENKIRFIEIPRNIKSGYQYYTKADLTNLRKIGYKKKFTPLKKGVKAYITGHLDI